MASIRHLLVVAALASLRLAGRKMEGAPGRLGGAGLRNFVVDQKTLLRRIQAFGGGVIDTSTLIYLERLGMLPLAAHSFSLLLIPQVAAEYGFCPEGVVLTPAPASGTTDELLCRMAQTLAQPVLSEDKQVLKQARAAGLSYYNTLMIVLALCAQGHLPLAAFPQEREKLRAFARYGPEIIAAGDAVYQALLQTSTGRQ